MLQQQQQQQLIQQQREDRLLQAMRERDDAHRQELQVLQSQVQQLQHLAIPQQQPPQQQSHQQQQQIHQHTEHLGLFPQQHDKTEEFGTKRGLDFTELNTSALKKRAVSTPNNDIKAVSVCNWCCLVCNALLLSFRINIAPRA